MASIGDHNHEAAEILLLPFMGQGHLFPFIELTKHLSNTPLNLTTTLLLPSSLSSSIPSSLRRHRLVRIAGIPSSASPLDPPPGPEGPLGPGHDQLRGGIELYLRSGPARPVCAVIDVMMGWAGPVFRTFGVPVVALFTSGACSAAVEYGLWKVAHCLRPEGDEMPVIIPGLPEEMAVSYADLKRWAHHHPDPPGPTLNWPHGPSLMGPPPGPRPDGPHGPCLMGPPALGQKPPWVDEVEGTVAVLINTCQELEGPFLDYLANELGKPVWGVGPLLPEEYWKFSGSPVHDHEIRAKKESNYTEEEVIQWLDSKPRGSVLYISFGSEVGPTLDEYAELARALEELDRPFIWVIRPSSIRPGPPPPLAGAPPGSPPREEGYYPNGLESQVGKRGLIICGWAPQLLILSHSSTGGFLSHCGWNSTLEAIGRAVPILAWPIRGDQHHNAKLMVRSLKVGYMVKEQYSSTLLPEIMVKKDDIIIGVEKLMTDEGIKRRANELRAKFKGGFPTSSKVALEAFRGFL